VANKDLFIDTSAWYALADSFDQYHEQAGKLFPRALQEYGRLVTTNLVVAETYILIRRELGHEAAITFLEKIAASPKLTRMYSDSVLEAEAEAILRRFNDQDFSFTDAVSFAFMKQNNIATAFAFDSHFLTAGFTLIS